MNAGEVGHVLGVEKILKGSVGKPDP